MDPLRDAIRRAIAQIPPRDTMRSLPPRESLMALATEAQEFVEATRNAMAEGAGGPRTKKRVVVGGLLSYALDIAWSSCHLLRTKPMETHIAVLTLWRPLFETWSRAAFFALEATEDEIDAFRDKGEVPRRPWPSRPDKPQDINPRLIARLIGPKLCPDDPELLNRLADEVKDWHALVHGGAKVVDIYDGGDTLQSQVSPDNMALKVGRVAVVAFLIGMIALNMSVDEGRRNEVEGIAANLGAKIRAFQARWPRHLPGGQGKETESRP